LYKNTKIQKGKQMKKGSKVLLLSFILSLSISSLFADTQIKYEEVEKYGNDNFINNGIIMGSSNLNTPKNNYEFKFLSCSGINDYPLVPDLYNVFYIDENGDSKPEYKVAIYKEYFSKCDNIILQYKETKINKNNEKQEIVIDKKVLKSSMGNFIDKPSLENTVDLSNSTLNI
jgi:hypothetical protein